MSGEVCLYIIASSNIIDQEINLQFIFGFNIYLHVSYNFCKLQIFNVNRCKA